VHTIPITPGSADQTTLRNVMLPAAKEEDSDVYFEVKALSRRGATVEVGQAYYNLKRLLADGRDLASAPVQVAGRGADAGTLTISLAAVPALRSKQP
jgi:hypothetical protein